MKLKETSTITELLPKIAAACKSGRAILLEAPPGAGKTTQLPLYLLRQEAVPGQIVVLEPRRLAARLAASYVARLLGEKPGGRVGYQVKDENVTGPRTRLRFVTDRVFVRQLLDDPMQRDVALVILDEFHERHLDAELALALVRRLRASARPDLGLIIMSATLDSDELAAKLEEAELLRVTARAHPLAIEHLRASDPRPLEAQVAEHVRAAASKTDAGHILVFLPGTAEIRRSLAACQKLRGQSSALAILPLYGDLPLAAQQRVTDPCEERKVILATNVAETSITIDGVTTVIDSGLARIAGYDAWSGLKTLRVRPISRAAAIQRAGRAGRTGPGRVLRLYTLQDYNHRRDHELPEIQRADLSELLLTLAVLGVSPAELAWIDAPPPAALASACELLRLLAATCDAGKLTPLGAAMARLPLHPRQARLLLTAKAHGHLEQGALLAASQSERRGRAPARTDGPSDLLAESEEATLAPEARRDAQKLMRLAQKIAVPKLEGPRVTGAEEALRWAILCAYPDRVAKRCDNARDELALASGGRARLSPASIVQSAPWLVALDAEAPRERGTSRLPLVHRASSIEPDWLLTLGGPKLTERDDLSFCAGREQVEAASRIAYGELVLLQTREPVPRTRATSKLLREHALLAGPSAFADAAALDLLLARDAFARTLGLMTDRPALDREAAARVLADLCEGRVSFAELRAASLLDTLEATYTDQAVLARAAPPKITLPCGKKLTVHYELGKPPWIESYLQDFFGMTETPRVGLGKVALTVHLLAPNRRPVQVTADLAGFWLRHYPKLCPALSRRYPRHAWPKDPAHATPGRRR